MKVSSSLSEAKESLLIRETEIIILRNDYKNGYPCSPNSLENPNYHQENEKKVITPVLIDITGIIKKHNCGILHEIVQSLERHKLQNSLKRPRSLLR